MPRRCDHSGEHFNNLEIRFRHNLLSLMVSGYLLIVRDLFFVSVRFEMINVSNFLTIAHD